jgi:hypothetical protein
VSPCVGVVLRVNGIAKHGCFGNRHNIGYLMNCRERPGERIAAESAGVPYHFDDFSCTA